MPPAAEQPPSSWDSELADRLVGRLVLVGVTTLAADGSLLAQTQCFGRVTGVDRHRGIRLLLEGSRAGEEFGLPPDTRSIRPAPPGEYRLRSTGEVVIDPDFVAEWTVQKPPIH